MMREYLVGIVFGIPRSLDWSRGLVPKSRFVTGLSVEADSREEALAWAEQVGLALSRDANAGEPAEEQSVGCECWLAEDYPVEDDWFRDPAFLQHVRVGVWPDLVKLKPEVYARRKAERRT
jgi:hypothetical protein